MMVPLGLINQLSYPITCHSVHYMKVGRILMVSLGYCNFRLEVPCYSTYNNNIMQKGEL